MFCPRITLRGPLDALGRPPVAKEKHAASSLPKSRPAAKQSQPEIFLQQRYQDSAQAEARLLAERVKQINELQEFIDDETDPEGRLRIEPYLAFVARSSDGGAPESARDGGWNDGASATELLVKEYKKQAEAKSCGASIVRRVIELERLAAELTDLHAERVEEILWEHRQNLKLPVLMEPPQHGGMKAEEGDAAGDKTEEEREKAFRTLGAREPSAERKRLWKVVQRCQSAEEVRRALSALNEK